jgi:putative ABC transport system permease protein
MRALLLIVSRSLRQHALSTLVTVFAVALATGLLMAVFSVKTQAHNAFTGGPIGFDAVLGARGSQLQLVLNTVFHLETSPGNIPWALYQEVKALPEVELAVPYAVGDNYKGFRIVGTTDDLFTKFEYQKGVKFETAQGRFFNSQSAEAVIGSFVAQRAGLKINDKFNPYHGVVFDEKARHTSEFTVVGILQPTNSPSDRVVWIPIDGIFRLERHVLRGSGKEYEAKAGEAIPDEHKEISAVMLKFIDPVAGANLSQTINGQSKDATLAWPIGSVMSDLLKKIGWMDYVLQMVAWLVVLVASASILASIYNTMNERRREFAILRALGARRRTVFSAIVLESTAIAALGTLLGMAVSMGIIYVAAYYVRQETGVVLDVFKSGVVDLPWWGGKAQSISALWFAPLVMIALGALAGIVPAIKAYRTDVSENLAPQA